MRSVTHKYLATAMLAALLTAGCSDTADSPEATTDDVDPAVSSPAEAVEPTPSADATSADGEVAVSFDTLTGEATRLTVDQSAVDALRAVGVTLSATGGATTESAGGVTTFVFPVTGGQATIDSSAAEPFTGTVEHEGGLQLSALSRNVTADGLVLDASQDQLTAMVEGRRVPLLPLATEPEVTGSTDEAVVSYGGGSLDTGALDALTGQLGLPSLPGVEVSALETTLSGS